MRRCAPLCIFSLLLGFLALAPLASSLAGESSRSATADEADVEFRLGNQAFLRGDCQRALAHYFASNRLVPNRNVVFNIAACYEHLGRHVEAYRYYDLYEQGATDEDDRANAQEALERTAKHLGLLRLESDPAGATIFVDRRDLGSYGATPQTLPLAPGTYQVILEHDAWESLELEVEIQAGQELDKTLTLTRREGTVYLSGAPTHLTVTVEPFGEPHALELPAEFRAPAGSQTLLIEAPGYEPHRESVDVLFDDRIDLTVALARQTGTVVVTSSEINSAVILDGLLVGFTPVVLNNVAVGTRSLTVQHDGFSPETFEVDVTRDGRFEVSANLMASNEVAAASRVAESIRDAPASVSLISSREIEAFAYAGTADALLGVRGIFLTNDFTYNLVGIRGYGPFGQFGNRTLMQIDGHVINDNWVEASYQQFEILSDLYGLDRIEVVRGPNSVLYGSGAFQGVINLVSADVDDPYRASRVGATAVTDGVVRGYAHLRQPFDDGGVQLSAGVTGGQAYDFFSPARLGSEESPTGFASNVGDFQALTLRGNARWRNLRLYSHWHDRNTQIATASYETLFGDSRSRANDQRGFVGLRYDDPRTDQPVTLHGRVYYDYYGYNGAFPYDEEDGGVLHDRFRGHWGGIDTRADIRPFESTRISIGAELVRHFVHDTQSATEFDGPIHTSSNPFWKTSAHLTLRQELGEKVSLWAGARYDLWLFESLDTPESGEGQARQIGNINPRAALILRPFAPSTVKIMGGRGFRAPSVYELTYNDGGLTQVANPHLEPETIYSAEVEYIHSLPVEFELVTALYANRIGTRIEQSGEGAEGNPLQFVNLDTDLWTRGAELELRRPFLQGWMASVQYSWQQTGEGELRNILGGLHPISNSPNHLAALRLIAPITRPHLQMANRLVFEAPRTDRAGNQTDPVFLWDLVFSGQIADLPLRYAAGVRNLLDWRYVHPVGEEILDVTLRQPGRTFVVDISAQF